MGKTEELSRENVDDFVLSDENEKSAGLGVKAGVEKGDKSLSFRQKK